MSAAASLTPAERKSLAIEVIAQTGAMSHLAAQHQVSRKFLDQQGQKANEALDASFNAVKDESEVLCNRPMTQTWLWQLILGLILICHSSYPWCGGTVAGFVRLTNQCGDNSSPTAISCPESIGN
jgi:hypothetical protein